MNAGATVDETIGRAQGAVRRAAKDLNAGAEHVSRTAASELGNLIADVEDLIKRVANVSDADLAKLRERLQEKIATAKDTLTAGTEEVRSRSKAAVSSTDDYVRGSPWQAVGMAAIAGIALGFLLSRR